MLSRMSESKVPNLRRLRTERRITQQELAEALGTVSRTILRWENGSGEPGATELLGMARFFGVSIDQLVSDILEGPTADQVVKVSSLSGSELDAWVAKLAGEADGDYSTDWAAGGPIIAREGIELQPIGAGSRFNGARVEAGWTARCADSFCVEYGETPLVAAMRAFVAMKAGAPEPAVVGASTGSRTPAA